MPVYDSWLQMYEVLMFVLADFQLLSVFKTKTKAWSVQLNMTNVRNELVDSAQVIILLVFTGYFCLLEDFL